MIKDYQGNPVWDVIDDTGTIFVTVESGTAAEEEFRRGYAGLAGRPIREQETLPPVVKKNVSLRVAIDELRALDAKWPDDPLKEWAEFNEIDEDES